LKKDPPLWLLGTVWLTSSKITLSYFHLPWHLLLCQQVCLYIACPCTDHMIALKHIMCYVKGTINYGLHPYSSPSVKLVSYTDVDWGGCPNTRRSNSSYCVFLGNNLISLSFNRQPTLSCSGAKVEYMSVANCWLYHLLLELHFPLCQATLVYYDNVSTFLVIQYNVSALNILRWTSFCSRKGRLWSSTHHLRSFSSPDCWHLHQRWRCGKTQEGGVELCF
jgi:hypothetical protein